MEGYMYLQLLETVLLLCSFGQLADELVNPLRLRVSKTMCHEIQ